MSVPLSVFISPELQAYKQNNRDVLNDGGYVGMVVVPEEAFPLPLYHVSSSCCSMDPIAYKG